MSSKTIKKAETADEAEIDLIRLFSTRFNELLDECGFPESPHARCQQLVDQNLASSVSGARKWCNGLAIPSPDRLVHLAARLRVTTDYLLGVTSGRTRPHQFEGPTEGAEHGPQMLEIPIYRFDESADEKRRGKRFLFVKRTYVEAGENDSLSGRKLCLVQNWETTRVPIAFKNDLLYLDLAFPKVIDNQVYLVSTPSSVGLRKVRATADHHIEFFARYDDRQNVAILKPEQVSFNESHSLNEPLPTSGIKLLGQLLGRIETYCSPLPGLG